MYIGYRLFNLDEQVENESKTSRIIRRNLNLLNMKFKTTIVESDLRGKKIEEDISELREIIMLQNERIDKLEMELKANRLVSKSLDEVISPIITSYGSSKSTPELEYSNGYNGPKTQQII